MNSTLIQARQYLDAFALMIQVKRTDVGDYNFDYCTYRENQLFYTLVSVSNNSSLSM